MSLHALLATSPTCRPSDEHGRETQPGSLGAVRAWGCAWGLAYLMRAVANTSLAQRSYILCTTRWALWALWYCPAPMNRARNAGSCSNRLVVEPQQVVLGQSEAADGPF